MRQMNAIAVGGDGGDGGGDVSPLEMPCKQDGMMEEARCEETTGRVCAVVLPTGLIFLASASFSVWKCR